jgi:alkylhydroperoxidase/carboxymuconolactone decarboxylase family protein YurZ
MHGRLLMRPAAASVLALVTLAALAGAACDDHAHTDIGDEINILIRRNDALVPPATERLAAYGRKAVPQIETAMHTAAPTGRLHLIAALELIADDESIPVLRHVAVYDVRPEVRDAAEALLGRWSAGGPAPRAEGARGALAAIARKRAAGEGPLLFGDAGTPGLPSTVGAPEPVGTTLK